MTNWLVYILENRKGTYYCGVTNNIHKRLRQHNGEIKGGAKFTRAGRLWAIVSTREGLTRSQACKLEYKVKKVKKNLKLATLKREVGCD